MTKENEERNQTEGKDSMTRGEKNGKKCWEKCWEFLKNPWNWLMGMSIVLLISGVVLYICESMDISHKGFENFKEMMQLNWRQVVCMVAGFLTLPVSLIGSIRKKTKKDIQTKQDEFSERYQNLRQKGYLDISIGIDKFEKMDFTQESKTIDYRNEAIQNFRKKMHNSEIGPRQWRRIILWLEEASDLCDVSEANTEVVETPIYISFMAIVVAALLGALDLIDNSQIGIVLLAGISVPLVVIFVSIRLLGYERRKTQEFNEYLYWRKMLLQVAKREVEARLSELGEEERKQKELEEEKKRCEQGAYEDKVLESTTQIEFFGKKVLRIDSEKGPKK